MHPRRRRRTMLIAVAAVAVLWVGLIMRVAYWRAVLRTELAKLAELERHQS